jgi:hypothetical protein
MQSTSSYIRSILLLRVAACLPFRKTSCFLHNGRIVRNKNPYFLSIIEQLISGGLAILATIVKLAKDVLFARKYESRLLVIRIPY